MNFANYFPNITNNPVILRETTARLRSFPSFLYLGVVLTIGYIFILVNWQFIQARVTNIYFDPRIVRQMFMLFNGSILVGIVCIVPFISANVITNEKERETWELLATTPLQMTSIVFGKLISSVFFVWLLLLSVLPFYGIFFLFGSVQFQEVMFIFIIATELTFVISLIGLYCSSRWNRTIKSVTITYILAFVYVAGLSLFSLLFHGVLFSTRDVGIEFLVSPLLIFVTYFDAPHPSIDYLSRNTQYMIHIFENVILVIVLLIASMRVLYNPPIPKPRKIFTDKRLNLNSEAVENWFKRFEPKFDIPDWMNPVERKEFHMLYHKRWMWISMMGLVLGGFAVFAFAMMRPVVLQPQDMMQILIVPLIFTPLLIIPYAANSIRGEYDRDTMDILLTTNIRAEDIITGKVRAAFRFFFFRFWAFGTLLVLSAMATAIWNSDFFLSVIPVLILTFCMAYFIINAATLISVVSKSAMMSYAVTGFIVFILYFGAIIIGFMMVHFVGMNQNYEWLLEQTSPIFITSDINQYSSHCLTQCAWMIVGSFLCYWYAVKFLEYDLQVFRIIRDARAKLNNWHP